MADTHLLVHRCLQPHCVFSPWYRRCGRRRWASCSARCQPRTYFTPRGASAPRKSQTCKCILSGFGFGFLTEKQKKTNQRANSLAHRPSACATRSQDYFVVTRRSIPTASTTTFTSAARLEKHAFMVTGPLVRNAASFRVERYIHYITTN